MYAQTVVLLQTIENWYRFAVELLGTNNYLKNHYVELLLYLVSHK